MARSLDEQKELGQKALALFDQGKTPSEVAENLSCSVGSVRNWVQVAKTGKPAQSYPKKKSKSLIIKKPEPRPLSQDEFLREHNIPAGPPLKFARDRIIIIETADALAILPQLLGN